MLARLLALAFLALAPPTATAQYSTLPGFPPGTFQSRVSIDAPVTASSRWVVRHYPRRDSLLWLCLLFCGLRSRVEQCCGHLHVATCTSTATIKFLATGYWDAVTAAVSTACSVACKVSKFYDSSGNANNAPVSLGTDYVSCSIQRSRWMYRGYKQFWPTI